MKVVCFGDSNTYGYDPRDYFGSRYAPEYRWVDLLAQKTGWDVRNNGMNGREIPRRETVFTRDLDLLIVMLGTNDLLQGNAPEVIYRRMEAFLTSIAVPKDKIVLIAPPPMTRGEWVQEQILIDRSVLLARWYQSLAGDLGIRFVDAGAWNIPLAFDGVHFTPEGHKAFAEGLYQYLNKGD